VTFLAYCCKALGKLLEGKGLASSNWYTVCTNTFLCKYTLVQFILIFLCAILARYELLTPGAIPKGFMDGKKAAQKMVWFN